MSKLLYTCFTKLIIDYLFSLNKSIPRRSDSKLHSSQDDHPITKLLNTTNSDYKFRMEVPDAMINDSIKKKAGYKYYIAKNVEREKAKIVDKPEEQHISPIKSGRGKGFMCYGDQVANVPNKLKKDVVPRKTRSLTIAEKTVVDMYIEWGQKLKGPTVKDPIVQSLLDLRKGSKASKLENTDSDATLYSSSSDKLEGSTNKTDDADELDMDSSDDNPDGDEDDARSHDNQDPPNNHKGENKKKRQKDVNEPSSISSRRNRSLVVQYNNDVELVYHVCQLKATVLSEAQWNNDEGDVSKPKSFKRHMSKSTKPHPCFYNNDYTYLVDLSTKEKYTTSITKNYDVRYYKEGIEDMIPKRWSKEVCRYHFEAPNGDLMIKSMNSAMPNLPRLGVNDVEDITVIKNRVEYIQLRVESYQRTLNLTKPTMFFELSEVKKFSDGTLVKIQENLIDMLPKNKLDNDNKRLKGRD
ncbi:hypothetical protein Tco_1084952 [Tanacetum coccineum]